MYIHNTHLHTDLGTWFQTQIFQLQKQHENQQQPSIHSSVAIASDGLGPSTWCRVSVFAPMLMVRFSHFVRNDFFVLQVGVQGSIHTYVYIHKNLNNRGNNIHTLLINHANISNPEWPHEIIQYLDLHFSTKHSFGSDFLQLMFFFGGRLNIWKPLSP